jgi:hypothetical protein
MSADLTNRVIDGGPIDRLPNFLQNGGGFSLHGERGMGKTALLEHLVLTVTACNAREALVQGEMAIDLAGLRQPCLPMLERQTS